MIARLFCFASLAVALAGCNRDDTPPEDRLSWYVDNSPIQPGDTVELRLPSSVNERGGICIRGRVEEIQGQEARVMLFQETRDPTYGQTTTEIQHRVYALALLQKIVYRKPKKEPT